jgi:hypothetical protein
MMKMNGLASIELNGLLEFVLKNDMNRQIDLTRTHPLK